MAASYGAAGRLAAAFIHSKLTPLFIVASMALGALAVVALPREEEPQIIVPMVDVFVEMPGRDAGRRGTARDAADGAAPLGGARCRVRLLDLERRAVDGGRPLQGRRSRRGGPRPAQSEARGQRRSHPARRHRSDRQAPFDRRRADPGGDRVVGALRRRPAAGAGRATARRHRRSHRRVRGDADRRAAASAAGGRRSGTARRLRAGPAGGSARDWRDQRARHRVGARHGRTDHRPRRRQPAADGRRGSSRRRQRRERPSRARARSGRGRGRRCRAHVLRHLSITRGRRPPSGHDRRGQAQGHQRHRRGASRDAEARHAEGHARALRRAPHDHPRLRRDRRREEQRTAVAHAARGALGVGAHLARARPARGGGGADRDSGHAGAHAVHVLPLRLHAQPHHALRPDLLHRHPRGRRDRGGGEHRAACEAEHGRVERARRRDASRRGRSGQPHHPGHARRGGGHSAHGLRRRPDGPVHATDSGRRVGGDGLLARRRLCRDAVGVGAAPEAGGPSRPWRRGSASRVSIGA